MSETRPSEEETQTIASRGSSLYQLSGREIDEFRLGHVIGKGGAGVVYTAEDETLHRKVAFKLLRPNGMEAAGGDIEARFLREARAVAKLDHPNIVQVHRVGKYDGAHYIVMQLIDGSTLGDYVADNPGIDVTEALRITRQIAEALQVAHDHGITHRDIKPSNIMIDSNGRVKVMDFGLARNSGPEAQLTTPGMFIGTPKYSSPEQCETKSIDQRSDLYSLGVILYELLSGQTPHEADTPMALMHRIIYEPPQDIRTVKKDLPPAVVKLLTGLLAKKPEKRTQTAAELIAKINAIIGDSTGGMVAPVRPKSSALKIVGLAAAVCLVAAVVWSVAGPGMRPATTEPANPVGQVPGVDRMLTFAMYDFQNLTEDPELAWMEIGMSDLITANLSQYEAINVLSRDQILWSNTDAGAVAAKRVDDRLRPRMQELNVAVVAKGKIVRVEDQVRVITILYSLGEDKILKSFSHAGDVSDLFALVDELGDDISAYFMGESGVDGLAVSASDVKADAGKTAQPERTWAIFSRRIANGIPAPEMASTDMQMASRDIVAPGKDGRKKLRERELKRQRPAQTAVDKKANAIAAPKAPAIGKEKPAPAALYSVRVEDQPTAGERIDADGEIDLLSGGGAPVANSATAVAESAVAISRERYRDATYGGAALADAEVAEGEWGYGGAKLADDEVVKVLPYYYRGLSFLSEQGIPPNTPAACRVRLCRQLAAEAKQGRPLEAALKRWQNKVLAARK